MLLDKFQMFANCYGGSNVLHMLILHSKCCINVPISCVQPGTCRNIWNVPNLLSMGKWQVLSTRACNVLKMFSLVSRPPCPQCGRLGCSWHCTAPWTVWTPRCRYSRRLGRRRRVGKKRKKCWGQTFHVEDGLMVQEATANAVVGSSCQWCSFMVFSSPPSGFICSLTGQTPDLLLPLWSETLWCVVLFLSSSDSSLFYFCHSFVIRPTLISYRPTLISRNPPDSPR